MSDTRFFDRVSIQLRYCAMAVLGCLLLSNTGLFAGALTLEAGPTAHDSTAVHFVVVVARIALPSERFVIALTNPTKIEHARRIVAGTAPQKIISGQLATGDGGYNRDPGSGRTWSWHMVPDTIEFVDTTVEIYDGLPSYVEDHRDEWIRTVGRFACWGSRLESEGERLRPGQFANQSARTLVGTGENVQIAGFVISGQEAKTVLVRAAGPALIPLGVGNVLADPQIELHNQRTGAVIRTNNDWSEVPSEATQIETVASRIGAAPWTRGSKDAAVVATLDPGIYTAVVRGRNNGTGIALIEVYNADDPTSTRLVNLSARSQTKTGDDVLIVGFVIRGFERKTVLIRAAGPALIPLGVTGALADPVLQLYNQRTGLVMATNDNWDAAPEMEAVVKAVGAGAWTRGSKDSALLVELEPGVYSAVVRGVNDGSGVALMEVFDAD